MSDTGRNESDDEFDFGQSLREHFSGFTWNYESIKKTNGETIPIPKTSTCVTAIFETDAIEEMRELITEVGATLTLPEHTRQYPDATLSGGAFGEKRIALDIKTARRSPTNEEKLDGPMTLGSYAGYFQNPDEDSPWTRFPYGTYDEHWIMCFAYYWDDEQSSLDMVSGVEVIVGEKWTLASRNTGTGTTNHIASIRDIPKLQRGDGPFESESAFEAYWRSRDNE